MSQQDNIELRFVEQLTKSWSDRGMMADLRRGIRVPNPRADGRHAAAMARLLHGVAETGDSRFYTVAALFAMVHTGTNKPSQPESIPQYDRFSIGASFRILRDIEAHERGLGPGETTSIDQRFRRLLDSDPEDLPKRLRHAVRHLALRHGSERKPVTIDWVSLLYDLRLWRVNDLSRLTQERWARDYWSRVPKTMEETASVTTD